MIHGDKTDWMTRAALILSDREDRQFTPFDRFAQFESSKGKTLDQLLEDFSAIRELNLKKLVQLNLSSEDLKKTGEHPAFGAVTLAQLLATWTVHDLDHLSQISRVMAKQYQQEVGPWVEFLSILKK